ncbi:MAG: DNA-directed RNA polymerases I II and III subunit RPABC2 [Alyxoria varia]|nr:MAG: DNA-directed RNA polymerases I II and III subunit RPABC2 [Alyxoria varia]
MSDYGDDDGGDPGVYDAEPELEPELDEPDLDVGGEEGPSAAGFTETGDDHVVVGADNREVQAQQAKNSLDAKAARKIPKEKRTTSPFLSKYERARVLGVRANQISHNAEILVDPQGEKDSLNLARMELEQRRLPLIVRRYLPDG